MTEAESSRSAAVPGEVLAGKYRVDRIIGQGGMGVVVEAHHLLLDEKVAIKFLLADAMQNPTAVGRFAREARAAVKINSEHVARVIDVGELENGAPYMVMEYLEGSDLSSLLARSGRLPVDQAVSYVLEACEALAEAHVLGIVHRDLKPANLFLANRPSGPPSIKVLDFGIPKSMLAAGDAQLTKTAAVMGSPLYMSPEQMQSSKSVDARADIWSLGVVLYELLAGATPFRADTFPELVLAVVQSDPVPLETLRGDVPPGLMVALGRCLTKAPGGRFSDVGQLAMALAPFALPRSASSVERIAHVLRGVSPVVVVGGTTGEPGVSVDASTQLHGPPSRRRDPAPTLDASMHAGTTAKPVSSDRAPTGPVAAYGGSNRWVIVALAVLVGPLVGVIAWQNLALHHEADRASAAVSQTPSAPSTEPPPVPSAASHDAPTTLPSAAPSMQGLPRSLPASTVASTRPGPARPTPAHAAAPPTATKAAKPNCDPPYTLDSANHRQYKLECLGGPH